MYGKPSESIVQADIQNYLNGGSFYHCLGAKSWKLLIPFILEAGASKAKVPNLEVRELKNPAPTKRYGLASRVNRYRDAEIYSELAMSETPASSVNKDSRLFRANIEAMRTNQASMVPHLTSMVMLLALDCLHQ